MNRKFIRKPQQRYQLITQLAIMMMRCIAPHRIKSLITLTSLRWCSDKSQHTIPPTMKAVLQTGYGDSNSAITFGVVPTPKISPFEVLVKVHAASLNQIDSKIRWGYGKGTFGKKAAKQNAELKSPPFIIGRDFSGEIVEAGENIPDDVDHCKLGNAVFGQVTQLSAQGTWCEYVKVPYWDIAAKPENLTHISAAALPYCLTGAIELYSALIDRLDEDSAKEEIAVFGCGGGVGYLLSLMLKANGFKVVGFCSKKDAPKLDKIIDRVVVSKRPLHHDNWQPESVFQRPKLLAMAKSDDVFQFGLFPNNMKAMGPIICETYLALCAEGLEKREALDFQGLLDDVPHPHLSVNDGDSKPRTTGGFLRNLFNLGFTAGDDIKFVESPQMRLYPDYALRRAYHLAFPKILESLNKYLTTGEGNVNIDTIYSFNDAIAANAKMDSGDYNGKIIITMDNVNDDSISYKTFSKLTEVTVPSAVCASLVYTPTPFLQED